MRETVKKYYLVQILTIALVGILLYTGAKPTLDITNPYAEEAVLFMDGLKMPFANSILQLDYGYPAIPIHMIWRISNALSGGRENVTVLIVRLLSMFFVWFCILRAWYILMSIKKITKNVLGVAMSWFIIVLFVVLNGGMYISFQLAYAAIPLITMLIAKKQFERQAPHGLASSKVLAAKRLCIAKIGSTSSTYSLISSRTLGKFASGIEIVILMACCLSKPLMWPMCLAYIFTVKKGTKQQGGEKAASALGENLIRLICVGLLTISIILVIDNKLNLSEISSLPNTSFAYRFCSSQTILTQLACTTGKYLGKLTINTLTLIILSSPCIAMPLMALRRKNFIEISSDKKNYKRNFLPILQDALILSVIIALALLSTQGFFTLVGFGLRDWTAIFPFGVWLIINSENLIVGFDKKLVCAKIFAMSMLLGSFVAYLNQLRGMYASVPGGESWRYSTYINRNNDKNSGVLAVDTCFYPGPYNWNSPYILSNKYTCIEVPLKVIIVNKNTFLLPVQTPKELNGYSYIFDSLSVVKINSEIAKAKSIHTSNQESFNAKPNEKDIYVVKCENCERNKMEGKSSFGSLEVLGRLDERSDVGIHHIELSGYSLRDGSSLIVSRLTGNGRKSSIDKIKEKYLFNLLVRINFDRVPYSSTQTAKYNERVKKLLEEERLKAQ